MADSGGRIRQRIEPWSLAVEVDGCSGSILLTKLAGVSRFSTERKAAPIYTG